MRPSLHCPLQCRISLVCLPESLHQHRDRAVLQFVQRVSSPCTLARGGGVCEGDLEGAGGDLEEAGGDLEGATQAVGWMEVTGDGMEDISPGMDGREDPRKLLGRMEDTGGGRGGGRKPENIRHRSG